MSNILFQGINENFPVAGEDNDTQTFRDNFDTIKRALEAANIEMTELESAASGAARLNRTNDFNLNVIQRVIFQNTREQVVSNLSLDIDDTIPIDYETGSYHILGFTGDQQSITLSVDNLPGDSLLTIEEENTLGILRLELYSNTEKTVEFATSNGTVIKKSADFPNPLIVDSDPVIIEVWRHNASTIFMRYLGQFS